MSYSQITLPVSTQGFIHKIFYLAPPPAGTRHPCRVLPDGCADLTLEISSSTVTPLLFGSSTRLYEFTTQIDAAYLGLRFRPGILPLFDDYQISDLLDSHITLAHDHDLRAFAEHLVDKGSDWNAIIHLARNFFSNSVKFQNNAAVGYLVQHILSEGGNIEISDAFSKVGYSPRQLERLFKKFVGFNAKKLSRIVRFQKANEMMQNSLPHAHIANECGYFDQAHMINEFKEFSLRSPTDQKN